MSRDALPVPPEAGAVRVQSRGPFAAGSTLWRDVQGRLICTVVAKATYKIAPGPSAPLDIPYPIQEEDTCWEDGPPVPRRSVHVPGDLAPFKNVAEVVLVGSAFPAARAVSSVARLIVGSVDKAIEAFPPRHLRSDGTALPGPALPRLSLRYEVAAGGPDTDNPAGIDVTRADGKGRYPIPQLLPPFHPPGPPGAPVPTCGFGAIAPTWPSRATLLGPNDHAWLRDPTAFPQPPYFPANFFQVAPFDQRLDRALVASERIVLEGLYPRVERLVMSLTGPEPRAVVIAHPVGQPRAPFDSAPETIRLTGDLLFIDTDRRICTLTYRGHVLLDGRDLRVIVVGVPVAGELSSEEIHRIVEHEDEDEDVETTHVGLNETAGIRVDPPPPPLMNEASWNARPVLPFTHRPQLPTLGNQDGAPLLRPTATPGAFQSTGTLLPGMASEIFATVRREATSSPAGAAPLPVRVPPSPLSVPLLATPVPATPARSEAPEPASQPAPPPVSGPAPPVVLSPPPLMAPSPAPMASSLEASPPLRLGLSIGTPLVMGDPPPRPAPRPPPEAQQAPSRSGRSSTSFDAAFGGVLAASNAAAAVAPAAPTEAGREHGAGAGAGALRPTTPPLPGRRQAVVSLLCFDAKILPRLRRAKRFAAPLSRKALPRRADEPRGDVQLDDRSEVLRVLSCGQPADAAEIRRALTDGLDDLEDFEPPLVLVAGELRPTFDEIEVLRATIAVVQPVAGGDKRILAAVAVGQEALAASAPPRSETTLGLARQIEQAAGTLSLPPRYVPVEVERILVEGRKYKRRTVLGASRVRADLTLSRSDTGMLLYLPETAATSLPLLPAFPVVAICEVTPREDLTETQDEALIAAALGRVLRSR